MRLFLGNTANKTSKVRCFASSETFEVWSYAAKASRGNPNDDSPLQFCYNYFAIIKVKKGHKYVTVYSVSVV
jgi:hypothetical protein